MARRLSSSGSNKCLLLVLIDVPRLAREYSLSKSTFLTGTSVFL